MSTNYGGPLQDRSPLREKRDLSPTRPRKLPALTRSAATIAVLVLAIAATAAANPIRPLANDFVAVGESPDPLNLPLYTPSILALPDGRLVAAYERGGTGREKNAAYAFILTSDDHGRTWTRRGEHRMTPARVFAAGKSLYFL
jgi:hypothetical protein